MRMQVQGKNKYPQERKGGLIKLIILIIIGVIALSYFNIDVRGIIEAPQTQQNFQYIGDQIELVWDQYLADPVLYFWNNIFIDLLWDSFVENMERIKEGRPTELQENSPRGPDS